MSRTFRAAVRALSSVTPASSRSLPSFPCVEAHSIRASRIAAQSKNEHLNGRNREGIANTELQSRSSTYSSSGPEPPYARPSPSSYQLFSEKQPLDLVYSPPLPSFDVAYETWGNLSSSKDNAILLFTGLSASSHAASTPLNPTRGWWENFIGPKKALDTDQFFVICANVLGGCYGSTGPSSVNPETGQPYATHFPIVSIFDMVNAQFRLLDHLGIKKLYASVGSSMGAMQSLAAGWLHPNRAGKVVSISGTARSSPSSIAMRFAQRSVLMSDPNWNNGFYYDGLPPHAGMKLARQIATITYRSGPEWDLRFGRKLRPLPDGVEDNPLDARKPRLPALCPDFLIETYLDHQGEQFCLKYDANSLIYISKAMDLFDMTSEALEDLGLHSSLDGTDIDISNAKTPTPAPYLTSLAKGLTPLANTPVLILGVQSDILFPVEQQREYADALRMAGNNQVVYYELGGVWGHDTFLIDVQNVGGAIRGFLSSSMSMDEDEQRQSPGRPSVTRSRSMSVNPINTDPPPLSTSQRNMSDMEQLGPRLSPSHTRQNIDPNDPDARERQRTMDVDIAMQMSRARRGSASVPIPGRQLSLTSTSNAIPSPIRGSPDQVFSFLPPHEEEIMPSAGSEGLTVDQVPSSLHVSDDTSDSHQPFNLEIPENSTSNVLFNLNQAGRETIDHPNALPMYQATMPRSNFDFVHMEQFCAEEKPRLGLKSPTEQRTLLSRVRSQDRKSIPRSSVEISEPVLPSNGGADDAVPERPASPETAKMRHRKISQSTNVQGTRRSKIGKLALFEGNVGSDGIFGAPVPSFIHANEGRFPSGPSGWNIGSSMGQGHERPYRFSFYSNALLATIHARSLSELPAEGQSFEDLFLGVRNPNEDRTNAASPAPNRPSRPLIPATATRAARMNSPLPGNDNNHGSEKKDRPTDGPAAEEDWEGNTWWLDVLNPTDEEMKMLSKVFSIHPLTTEDIQMEEAREKIELFRNYYLVCFRSFDQDQYSPTYLEPVNMYIIVFREGTLSFHFRPTPHPQNVRRRITQLKDYINVTSDWISYALIDDITDAFGPLIQSIEYEVDSIDELVLILKEAEQSDMLRRIGTCRKKVMGLLRLMGNKADVVKGLAKRCNENWSVAPKSDIGLYLSDIQDHLITMTQNLNHYEKILSRSHSNYLAQISIEMTDANNQINDVLSKLTALGTVLIPMNLITGLWGMNVHVPGQDDQTTYIWFFSIVGSLLAIAVVGSFLTYRLMVSRS